MPDFVKELGSPRDNFYVNEFRRSTKNQLHESYTASMLAQPYVQRNDGPTKILQPGTVIAKITSGPEAGKCGPFQAAGTQEVQSLTPTGTFTSGTIRLKVGADQVPTAPLALTATLAQIKAAIVATGVYEAYEIVVGGGATLTGAGATTYTFTGPSLVNEAQITADTSSVVGGGTLTAATTTQGAAGSNDGRSTLANIVGVNQTPVMWRLNERDVEISVLYAASLVQAWCYEHNAAGLLVPVSNATAAAMQRGGAAGKLVDITWN